MPSLINAHLRKHEHLETLAVVRHPLVQQSSNILMSWCQKACHKKRVMQPKSLVSAGRVLNLRRTIDGDKSKQSGSHGGRTTDGAADGAGESSPCRPGASPGASRHSLSGLKLLGSGGIRTHAPEETGA